MPRHRHPHSSIALLFYYVLLLKTVLSKASTIFCSRAVYGVPSQEDCTRALLTLPIDDESLRYFIEQQLATFPPQADWPGWTDSRPKEEQTEAVQVPKFWGSGTAYSAMRLETSQHTERRGIANTW